MTKKGIFLEVGGFNEEQLPTKHYDVDLCLKITGKGYRILYTPFAQFVIHQEKTEGTSAGGKGTGRRNQDPEEDYMQKRWGDDLGNDPYYNPNLSADGKFHINTGAVRYDR